MTTQNTQAQIQTTAIAAGNGKRDIESYLLRALPSLQQICSRFITPQRLVKIALVARARVPNLSKCSPESLLLALMSAAELGLEPNTPLQHAALVPFKNRHTGQYEVEYWPMYQGLIELGRRSFGLRSARAVPIWVGDDYKVTEGLARAIEHTPKLDNPNRGQLAHLILVYAVIEVRAGQPEWTYMTRPEIDDVKRKSRAANDGPWATDYGEMAKKTVIRRLMKQLPLSPEAQAFLAHDEVQTGDAGQAEILDGLMTASEARAKVDQSSDGYDREDDR